MPHLQYQGNKYGFEQLKRERISGHPAFEFCHQWLNGQEYFTFHTSGSTGKPKPIRVAREQMEASIRGTAEALSLSSQDRALICLNTGYIGGMMMLARTLYLGMEALILPPEGNPLAQVPQDFRPTFIAIVPLQLEKALAAGLSRKMLDKSTAAIVGGAPVPPKLEQSLQSLQCSLYSTYGMTETVSHIALRRLNGPDRSREYQALPGVEVAQDERGCLKIRGSVTLGKWLQTNDQVEMSADGRRFHWIGRADQVVNSGGVKVSVAQVERAALECLQNKGLAWEAAVVGLPDERLGEKIAIAFSKQGVREEDWEKHSQDVLSQLQETLPPYHAPKSYFWVSAFPLTPSQKTDRRALAQQLSAIS